MDSWNTTFLLGRPIFRGYVSLQEGNGPKTEHNKKVPVVIDCMYYMAPLLPRQNPPLAKPMWKPMAPLLLAKTYGFFASIHTGTRNSSLSMHLEPIGMGTLQEMHSNQQK